MDRMTMSHISHTTTDRRLAESLIAHIRKRAGARVRDVEVTRINGSLIVRGQAQSYYAWQLAIAACHDVLSRTNGLKLDCTLDVDQR